VWGDFDTAAVVRVEVAAKGDVGVGGRLKRKEMNVTVFWNVG
jgi:hypothetical protein